MPERLNPNSQVGTDLLRSCVPTAGGVQRMAEELSSLRNFLHEHLLAPTYSGFSQAQARSRIEESSLPHLMRETCSAINHEAGRHLVDGHYYLPPQPMVNSFAFVLRTTEFVMQLETTGLGPCLVFIVRKWRDRPPSDFLGWLFRLLDVPPCRVHVPYAYMVNENIVSEQEVKRWFFFLLSGLDRQYAPTLPLWRAAK